MDPKGIPLILVKELTEKIIYSLKKLFSTFSGTGIWVISIGLANSKRIANMHNWPQSKKTVRLKSTCFEIMERIIKIALILVADK